MKGWRVIALALCVLAGCSHSRPAPTTATAARSAPPLIVVTLNLWHDKQDWPHREVSIARTLQTLRPDMILLEEVLQDPGLTNQAQSLAERLGYDYRFFSVDAEDKAHRFGNAILSRHAMGASEQIRLEPLDDYRNAGWVRLTIDGRPLNVYVTHLHYTPEGGAIRERQIRSLTAFIEHTRGSAPSLLGGDFNTTDTAPELAALAPAFRSAYPAAHPGENPDAPAHATLNPHMGHPPLRIDHVFFQADAFRVLGATVLFDQPDAGGIWASDHFGLMVRLQP